MQDVSECEVRLPGLCKSHMHQFSTGTSVGLKVAASASFLDYMKFQGPDQVGCPPALQSAVDERCCTLFGRAGVQKNFYTLKLPVSTNSPGNTAGKSLPTV